LIAYKGLWAATAKKDEDGITSDNYTEITSLNGSWPHLGFAGRLLPSGSVKSSYFLPKGACRIRFPLRKVLSHSAVKLQAGSKPQVWP
jgi:hypothetical protein